LLLTWSFAARSAKLKVTTNWRNTAITSKGNYPGTGFFVDGPVQVIGDYVRLPFVLKEHDGSTVVTGQDFLRLAADGRAELMYAFFDE
jgi:hypothetical protein